MARTRAVITIDAELLAQVDQLVVQHSFPSRGKVIEAAVRDMVAKTCRSRLARECAKLDPGHEQALAEEGMGMALTEWPEY